VIRFSYLAVLACCFLGTLWLEIVLKVNVYRRWRRLLLALAPTVVVFVAWDVWAIGTGQWGYDERQLVGVAFPGGLPLEELLFFLVIPVCAILGFEAVRAVRGWPAGDEPLTGDEPLNEPAGTHPARAEPAASQVDEPAAGRER
jgi:lycopene cyclase domain-containing protein